MGWAYGLHHAFSKHLILRDNLRNPKLIAMITLLSRPIPIFRDKSMTGQRKSPQSPFIYWVEGIKISLTFNQSAGKTCRDFIHNQCFGKRLQQRGLPPILYNEIQSAQKWARGISVFHCYGWIAREALTATSNFSMTLYWLLPEIW